ncbi:hypothetical protein [Nitrosomonas oligotropha]|nr:hypothetical protein [Nitrosomonas oligotropha]
MQSRVEKSIARLLVVKFAPECGEVLSLYRAKRDGWIKMPEEIEQIRKHSGLGDAYVLAYEAEPRILSCLMKFLCPEDTVKKLKEFDDALIATAEKDKLELVERLLDELENDNLSESSLETEGESIKACETAQKEWESISEDEKAKILSQIQLFFAFFYAYFYNHIALMVHGQKLTTLVPLALQGNQKAFCKAVQIDRNLLTGHPYFRDTYARLLTGEDPKFLKAIASHLNRPPIQGKIRFPALYMLFAVLDGFKWLDDFTATEILDVCDDARLDRYQNRIEDESYLIKRRLEYRKKQKIGF